jgi:TolA-binding protein
VGERDHDKTNRADRAVAAAGWLRRRGALLPLLLLWGPACAELPPTAWKELREAENEYQAERYAAAVARLDKVLRDYPACSGSDEAYYLRSLCRARLGRSDDAKTDALACIKYASQADLKAKAQVSLGSLLFEQGRLNEALPHYAAAIGRLPDKGAMDLVQYRYGLCLQREGRWREARAEFATVCNRYPGGAVAEHARRAAEWRNEFFSIQCGACRDQGGANQLKDELSKAGLPVRVEKHLRSGEELHMVYVGRYARYEQAQEALGSVRRRAPGAQVVP